MHCFSQKHIEKSISSEAKQVILEFNVIDQIELFNSQDDTNFLVLAEGITDFPIFSIKEVNGVIYVEENEIIRPDDLIVKSTGANSGLKLYIIQNVDRKLSIADIASAKGLEIPELIKEMEQIVNSGTKLNIGYYIDEVLDEDQQEEMHDYFLEADSDDLEEAMEEFDGEYEEEDLRLYRLKFISEVAN